MKTARISMLGSKIILVAIVCWSAANAQQESQSKSAAPRAEGNNHKSDDERISYAMGMFFGSRMPPGSVLDQEMLIKSFRDVIEGTPLLSARQAVLVERDWRSRQSQHGAGMSSATQSAAEPPRDRKLPPLGKDFRDDRARGSYAIGLRMTITPVLPGKISLIDLSIAHMLNVDQFMQGIIDVSASETRMTSEQILSRLRDVPQKMQARLESLSSEKGSLKTKKEQMSYAIGCLTVMEAGAAPVEPDVGMIVRALKDSAAGHPRMTVEKCTEIMRETKKQMELELPSDGQDMADVSSRPALREDGFKSDEERVGYAMGRLLAEHKKMGLTDSEKIDLDVLEKGMRDYLAWKPRMTTAQILQYIQSVMGGPIPGS